MAQCHWMHVCKHRCAIRINQFPVSASQSWFRIRGFWKHANFENWIRIKESTNLPQDMADVLVILSVFSDFWLADTLVPNLWLWRCVVFRYSSTFPVRLCSISSSTTRPLMIHRTVYRRSSDWFTETNLHFRVVFSPWRAIIISGLADSIGKSLPVKYFGD